MSRWGGVKMLEAKHGTVKSTCVLYLINLENAVEMAWHPKSLVQQGVLGNLLNCRAVEFAGSLVHLTGQ
jgi:hypothetical protein